MLKLFLVVAMVQVAAGLDLRTIITYLNDYPEFSTLLGLLKTAHLDIVLEADGALFTLFAPTNQAFDNLPPGLLAQVQQDPMLLQKVLMTHVLDLAFISTFIQNERVENTLSNSPLRFNIYNQTYTAGGAPITQGDIVLRNGVIHVIDGVILPPEGDVLRQILTDDEEFEDLTAALAVTNLLDDLESSAITLFAPLNSAFRAYYQDGLPNGIDEVKDLLLNHLINGTYYQAGIQNGDTLTSLSGNTLTFTKTANGEIRVNGHRTDGVIFATNGIIHVMTGVLDPSGN